MAERSLRCVVLDRVYDLWSDAHAQRLFQNLVDLKRVGFGKEYGYGVLPVDTLDLTSTHFAIVDERQEGMVPLMAARMTTLDRARLFNTAFPALQLCALAAAPYHGSAVQQLIDRCTAEGRKLTYWGLWTIHPEARADRELATYLANSLGGIGHLLARDGGVTDQVMGATLRFKVDRVGRAWGFEPLLLDGAPLPPLEVAHLLGEPVLLMHQRQPSEAARELMDSMQDLWEKRLVLAPEGRISDDPPPGAKVNVRADGGAELHAPAATSSYLPSVLYARDRYGAIPEVPVGQNVDYLKALMAIVGADGAISANEWLAIQELVRKLGMHEKVLQELRRFDWRHADLAAHLQPLGAGTGRRMLYDAARIAYEEGLSEHRQTAIHSAAGQLDIPHEVVDSILALVRDEADIGAIRAAELFPERGVAAHSVSDEGHIVVGSNLLQMLSSSDRARLFALGRPQVVEAHAEVVRQGSAGDCLFVIEEGELAVVRCLPGDDEEVLVTAPAGSLLGELAVLDGGARTASLRALRRSVLRVIELSAFEALTLHGGDTGHRILKAVAASVHDRLVTTRRLAASGVAQEDVAPAVGTTLAWNAASGSVIDVLRMLPAFGAVRAAEWKEMLPQLRVAPIERGSEIVLPEPEHPAILLVLRGALTPWLGDSSGPEATTPSIAPGGVVEYAAALGFAGEPRRWRARSPTQLLRLDAGLFDPRNGAAARLLYGLSRDLATTLRRTTGLSMHFRMAHFRMAWVRPS